MRYGLAAAAVATMTLGPCARSADAALVFNFTRANGTSVADYNTILPKFQEAANRWSSLYSDSMTVNVRVSYVTLADGLIGSTTLFGTSVAYSSYQNALIADAKTAADTTAVASLPNGTAFSVLTRDQPNSTVLQTPSNSTQRNTTLSITNANAKAVGLLSPNNAFLDASITFSKAYTFDYDGGDGISPGTVDFVGVATHELGHAMGFSSGVDTIDRFTGNGPSAGTPTDLSSQSIYNPIDLFRHSATAGLGIVDGVPGDDSWLSLDGGATLLAPFSRGTYNGDGLQASHWRDNLGVGIMDPTASKGELLTLTNNDWTAFDAIGYDFVPEPASFATLLAPIGLGMLSRRRRLA
jgi:hypothetical protein